MGRFRRYGCRRGRDASTLFSFSSASFLSLVWARDLRASRSSSRVRRVPPEGILARRPENERRLYARYQGRGVRTKLSFITLRVSPFPFREGVLPSKHLYGNTQRGPAGGGRSVCIGAPSRSGRQGIGGTRVCVKSETLLNETFALRACLAKTNRWLVAATTLSELESNVRKSTSQKNAPRSPECRTLSSRDLASSLNASTDP